MFLNCNEAFSTSFALNDLLTKLVAGVCEKRPVSSREVLELMSETLDSNKMKTWYYTETVRSFKASVDSLNRRGFPMQMTCPLYFRVPLEDGGVDELFPCGSQVAVTPNNFDAFDHMLRQYYLYRGNQLTAETYFDAVRRYLPISAQRNLLNPSFTPILKFMLEHFLNPDSPWLVRSEAEWRQLGVTYAVPLAGRFFPVDPTKPATLPVPFSDAANYVELANDTCNKLYNLIKTGAALSAFRQSETPMLPPLLPPPTSSAAAAAAERGVAMRPSPPPPQQQQQQQPNVFPQSHNHIQQPQPQQIAPSPPTPPSLNEFSELEAIGLRRETCQNMTAAELSFWDYILQLRRNPAQIQDVSFRLEFGGGKFIDLKANGAFIPVTRHNVEQFIEAAVKKQQEVHRYINEIASTTTTTTSSATPGATAGTSGAGAAAAAARRSPGSAPSPSPCPSSTTRNNNIHNNISSGAAAVASTAAAAALTRPAPPAHESGTGATVNVGAGQVKVPTKPKPRTEVAAAGTMPSAATTAAAGAVATTASGASSAFNETRLRLADVDSPVVRSMLGLRALYNENRLTAAELAAHNLRFCLPCTDGVYNLIPNGREIKVGLRNFGEFMLRLDEEKRRVEAEEAVGMADAVLPLEEDNEAYWTDRNILEIWTYEVTTDLLAKSGLPPDEVVQQTRLQWDTHFLRNTDDPHNVMSGPRGEILPHQLKNYLELLHHRLQTIRLAILDARQCSKQPSDVDSNDLGEAELATAAVVDVALPAGASGAGVSPVFYPPPPPQQQQQSHPVPPPPTEEDLNMFSPTHNTGDLLAPPQSFNH